MLTLCTEQAIEDEDWEAVNGLLQRREEVLATLERLDPDPRWLPLLRRAMEADARCQETLRQKQRGQVHRGRQSFLLGQIHGRERIAHPERQTGRPVGVCQQARHFHPALQQKWRQVP